MPYPDDDDRPADISEAPPPTSPSVQADPALLEALRRTLGPIQDTEVHNNDFADRLTSMRPMFPDADPNMRTVVPGPGTADQNQAPDWQNLPRDRWI